MIDTHDKAFNLQQLQQELIASGLDVSNGLGVNGNTIYPYKAAINNIAENGTFLNVDLAQSIFDKHVPTPSADSVAINDFRSNYDVADQRLGDIVANIGTYTNAQLRDSIGDIARILRRLLHLGRALNG